MPFREAYALAFTLVAVVILLNAIDDLVPAFICLAHLICRIIHPRGMSPVAPPMPPVSEPGVLHQPANVTAINGGERRIAIFVPCWKESGVIGNMVRHNLAAIRYSKMDFFLGVYPNDKETLEVVNELARLFRNVHAAEVPHDGPTSKADCLNWTYQSLCDFEASRSIRLDTVVVHDAEDLIHPDALRLIHSQRFEYDMVQVPVLPLPTSIGELTHGIYCDEFAEFQAIDMRARIYSRSFLPSNGVGTGYSRDMLDRLAEVRSNCVFEPVALTEDYESGVRIHQAGFKQTFARMLSAAKSETGTASVKCPIATREYFPRDFRSAVRQRTRWVTGICLQGWERLGWRGSGIDRYWFWRDRKALFTNPLGMIVSLLMLVALVDYVFTGFIHQPWHFAMATPSATRLCILNIGIQILRSLVRMVCVGRIYGPHFALGVPVRTFYESFINGYATLRAWQTYVSSRVEGRPLVWLKTEHTYPSRASLSAGWKTLEEVLVGSDYVAADVLALAQRTLAPEMDLGTHLVENGWISQQNLWEALSLASNADTPFRHIELQEVNGRVSRFVPRRLQRDLKVLPIAVRTGTLIMATPVSPTDEIRSQLARHTELLVEFQLVTPGNFASLNRHLGQWRAKQARPVNMPQRLQPTPAKASAASA